MLEITFDQMHKGIFLIPQFVDNSFVYLGLVHDHGLYVKMVLKYYVVNVNKACWFFPSTIESSKKSLESGMVSDLLLVVEGFLTFSEPLSDLLFNLGTDTSASSHLTFCDYVSTEAFRETAFAKPDVKFLGFSDLVLLFGLLTVAGVEFGEVLFQSPFSDLAPAVERCVDHFGQQ